LHFTNVTVFVVFSEVLRFCDESKRFLALRRDLPLNTNLTISLLEAGLSFQEAISQVSWDGANMNIKEMVDPAQAIVELDQYVRCLAILLIAKKTPASNVNDLQRSQCRIKLRQLRAVASRIVSTCLEPPVVPTPNESLAARAMHIVMHANKRQAPIKDATATLMYEYFISQLLFLVQTCVLRGLWTESVVTGYQKQLLPMRWGWDLYEEAAGELIRAFGHLKHKAKQNSWPDLHGEPAR
jgi:hypothetical protein